MTPENLEDALALRARCLDDALDGRAARADRAPAARARHRLRRDLEGFVRDEAASGAAARAAPASRSRSAPSARRPSCSAASDSAEDLSLSGKIDRIDVDPFSARGIVQDYKSGKSAHSAREIEPRAAPPDPALHARAARPRRRSSRSAASTAPLAGERRRAGCCAPRRARTAARLREERLPRRGRVLEPGRARARASARTCVERIRAGDVRHDPKGGDCPTWCDLWPMCRVTRA